MSRRLLVLPVLVVVLAAAGCGSGSGGGTGTGSASAGYGGGAYGNAAKTPASTPAAGSVAAVGTAKGSVGTYLVDAAGRSLYLFQADKGTTSTCTGACAQAWPPLTTTGAPKATGSATGSMLATTKRADGTMQVTYGGHPLYRYAPDTAAGQTTGQGVDAFGALWYLVAPVGSAITG